MRIYPSRKGHILICISNTLLGFLRQRQLLTHYARAFQSPNSGDADVQYGMVNATDTLRLLQPD